MFSQDKNSIVGVVEAKNKLMQAIKMKYPNNDVKYYIGINPESGKYTVIVETKTVSMMRRFPETVFGYRVVVDGYTKLNVPPMDIM